MVAVGIPDRCSSALSALVSYQDEGRTTNRSLRRSSFVLRLPVESERDTMTTRTLSWPGAADDDARAEAVEPARATTGGGGGGGIAPVCVGVVAGPLRAELARS